MLSLFHNGAIWNCVIKVNCWSDLELLICSDLLLMLNNWYSFKYDKWSLSIVLCLQKLSHILLCMYILWNLIISLVQLLLDVPVISDCGRSNLFTFALLWVYWGWFVRNRFWNLRRSMRIVSGSICMFQKLPFSNIPSWISQFLLSEIMTSYVCNINWYIPQIYYWYTVITTLLEFVDGLYLIHFVASFIVWYIPFNVMLVMEQDSSALCLCFWHSISLAYAWLLLSLYLGS